MVFAFSKTQDGYHSLQAFSETQNVTLAYNDDGQLTDRGTVEGAEAIMTQLTEDWGYPVVESDFDPDDPLVNTASEYMFQMATVGYDVLHGTQTVTLAELSNTKESCLRPAPTNSKWTAGIGPTSTGNIP